MNINTEIKFNIELGKRFVLGVDGLSRSGKTTFVAELIKRFDEKDIPFHVIHLDDHIVERSFRYGTGKEEWFEYYQMQWDVECLSRNLFEKLKSNDRMKIPFYDEQSDRHEFKEVILPTEGIVVVEGVFLQREEWRSYFDCILYLDCPREHRFARESKETQMKKSKFENRYWPAEEYYLQTVTPKEKADVVIESNHSFVEDAFAKDLFSFWLF